MSSRFDVISVDAGNIESGTNTVSGNPICKALREHGYRGARIDLGGLLHLYDGKQWTLCALPKAPQNWLDRFLRGKQVKPFSFGLPRKGEPHA